MTGAAGKDETAASPLTQRMFALLAASAQRPQTPDTLNAVLRDLSKWRAHLIQATLLQDCGVRVLAGPFAGLDFVASSAEGCHVPKLLGCYEQPLHPSIERAIAQDYTHVLNIGCAEGYYAVGLARRMENARIEAFDTNAKARAACEDLAARNGVADRITIGEEFRVTDFARFAGTRCLVVCDIEGAEDALLDPVAAPALAGMDLVVEVHDCYRPGLSGTLAQRLSATHTIEVIGDSGDRRPHAPPPWFRRLGHLDQLLAVWEWRTGPTPWLVCTAHQRVNQIPSG